MSKHIQKKFKNVKKDIKTMGDAVNKINLNNSISSLNFNRVTNAKSIIHILLPLINKYNGVIYGTTIGTSIKNNKIAIRKTDDIDVRFDTEKNRTAFVNDAKKALGKRCYIKDGHFGAIIKDAKTHETICDTHVKEKGWTRKIKGGYQVTDPKSSYVTLKSSDKKIKQYNNVKGESYTTSAQAKFSATLVDLNEGYKKGNPRAKDKLKRIGKDAFDTRMYNADTLVKAYEQFKKEKDPQKKEELRKVINKLARAILRFSARKDVMNHRKIAEKEYIKKGMLNKRTFTDSSRLRKEEYLYKKIQQNPDLDITEYGIDWIKAVPLKKNNKSRLEINFSDMI